MSVIAKVVRPGLGLGGAAGSGLAEWTLREIAEHVAGVTFYAEQVGSLAEP